MPNKNLYIDAIETVIKKINQNEKENIFTIFSKLDDNYGAFNKMRIEKTIDIQKTKNIFENETSNIYSQLIEIALDENIDIKEILVGLSYTKIEGLIDELLKNRKESVSKLFDYIIETNLSFNPYSIMVDIIICEKLLYTSYLSKDKKIKIFNLYTSIRYIYLQITQSNLNNEELILLSTNQEDVFVSTLKHIEESFYNDIIKTIKLYKNLGEKFPKYIDFIKIKVDKINTEFNSNSELKMLKTQFVVMIKNAVATNNLELAKSLLSEFESIDNNRNSDIESIKSIIALNEGDIKNSHKHIKKSYLENNDNFDAIYNLGYIYFLENNFAESLYCFEYIVSKCKDSNIVADAIDFVESNLI
jgi:hypothetical protein